MLDIKHVLESRLLFFESIAQQGVIPGQLDNRELQEMIGRIKELKVILNLFNHEAIDKNLDFKLGIWN